MTIIMTLLFQYRLPGNLFFSASVFGIGAIFGGFASGILGSQLGRRKTILVMTVPDVIGWILIASAQDFPMMLIGRFLCGFASAGYMPAIQVI